MHPSINEYHTSLSPTELAVCETIFSEINKALPEAENKIWHRHPVWFLDGNPVVGYSKLKSGIRLLFWSGQTFGEEGLKKEGSFKAAEIRYSEVAEIDITDLHRWLEKSRHIQWDYKNLVKRKGELIRLK